MVYTIVINMDVEIVHIERIIEDTFRDEIYLGMMMKC